MNFYDFQIVFQEVPDHISLCFYITGCDMHCDGCHSPFLWKKESGTYLDDNTFQKFLIKYHPFGSCVLFMGGEWDEEALIQKLRLAKKYGYKTCLYTGREWVSDRIIAELNFIKTGPFIADKGGLDKPDTNQRFIDLDHNIILNHKFIKTPTHDSTYQPTDR